MKKFSLFLFDGEAEAQTAPVTSGETSESSAPPAEEAPASDRGGKFEELIRGEYRDEFQKRVQGIINRRFKEEKRAAMPDRSKVENAYVGWMGEAKALKEQYPSFELREEVKNEGFLTLLRRGVDMKTAYESTHRDELLLGAMRYAVEETRRKMTSDIASRAARPAENGTSGAAPSGMRTDVSALSRKQREEISRRVLRGEKITF